MKYELVALYLAPISGHFQCSCKVERNEQGDIVLPDLDKCGFVQAAHDDAIKRAVERIKDVPLREIED